MEQEIIDLKRALHQERAEKMQIALRYADVLEMMSTLRGRVEVLEVELQRHSEWGDILYYYNHIGDWVTTPIYFNNHWVVNTLAPA